MRALSQAERVDEAGRAWLAFGIALLMRGRKHEAAAMFRQAIARQPDCLEAWLHLGDLDLELLNHREAIRYYQGALALDAHNTHAHVELGRAFHRLGDHERGLDEFARGLRAGILAQRTFAEPEWDGSALTDRTILVWADAALALGDTIQFLRYVPYIKEEGARVIVECADRLVPIVRGVSGVDRVVARDEPLPAFDLHAPLMLLPGLVRQRCETVFGAVPYLSIDDELRAIWRKRLAPAANVRTVGISWAGKPGRRSVRTRFIPLAAFAPLAAVPGVRLISLQRGPQCDELLAAPPGLQIECLQDDGCTMPDTAALIASLDLVITVDTMTAHLAGALARPVWTLLSHVPSWRWGFEGDRTPWYPSMRLFRQRQSGEWEGVIQRVRAALENDEWNA